MGNGAPTVGWIGTGRMGYQLALRLLRAGNDVAVYNRTKAKAEPLAASGAKIVDRPVDLADRDVVFIMVAADGDLEAVLTGDGGLLTGSRAPDIIVDSSTVSPQVSAEARAVAAGAGAAFLAAPVSGNPKVIAAGKLTVAVSGPREAFDAVAPLLATFGRGVTYCGEGETARLVKIAHNVFLGVVIQALTEITVLAERGGVSRAAFLRIPQRLGARLGILQVQVARAGQPRLPPVVHHRAAPQGPPARPGRGPGTRRADAAGGRGRHAHRAGRRGRLHRR